MNTKLSYPEIEATAVNHSHAVDQIYSKYRPPTTLVDLLEVGQSTGDVFWKRELDHDSLLKHVEGDASRDTVAAPALRVFFLGTLQGSQYTKMFNELQIFQCARLHPSTALWMRDRFAVSPIFLDCVTAGNPVLSTGNNVFLQREEKGDIVAISAPLSSCIERAISDERAGFYQLSSRFHGGHADGGPSHVWFSHDLQNGSSTYILDNCPSLPRRLIKACAFGEHADALRRVCAIDAFIAEDCGKAWGDEITVFRNELLKFEHMRIGLERLSPAEMSTAVEQLHHLSQNFHIISENIADLEERLEYLRDVHRQYMTHSPDLRHKSSVAESLQFLASRTKMWKRWAMNYKDRTEIRINLFFNLASQNDNRTNLDIASFTSKIAVDTQRDSSSMITIAAVTMFFLPGTFVSALFSMVFFNAGTDENGRDTITVSSRWWYFIAITVPLTIIVFVVWVLWQRWRNTVKGITGATTTYDEKV